jgi:hypothetical protein
VKSISENPNIEKCSVEQRLKENIFTSSEPLLLMPPDNKNPVTS